MVLWKEGGWRRGVSARVQTFLFTVSNADLGNVQVKITFCHRNGQVSLWWPRPNRRELAAKRETWRCRQKNQPLPQSLAALFLSKRLSVQTATRLYVKTEPRLIPYCQVSSKPAPYPLHPVREPACWLQVWSLAGDQIAISSHNPGSWTTFCSQQFQLARLDD